MLELKELNTTTGHRDDWMMSHTEGYEALTELANLGVDSKQ